MEWIPKTLDNLDSAALALYQSLTGYFLWVFLRFALSVAAVIAMTASPAIRFMAVAAVTTYVAVEFFGRRLRRARQPRIARQRG